MAAPVYDLLIVIDCTASMGNFLHALGAALPDIIRLSLLTDCFARIGIVAYRDYDQEADALVRWSGWYWVHGPEAAAAEGDPADPADPADPPIAQEQLLAFAKGLRLLGGHDVPEATKTGLAVAYAHMRAAAETVVLLYADAPPHTARPLLTPNHESEQAALADPAHAATYGPDAPVFRDWVRLTRLLRGGDDDDDADDGGEDRGHRKRARVFCVVDSSFAEVFTPYVFLSARTGGTCFTTGSRSTGGTEPQPITDLTMAILLAWMGEGPDEAADTISSTVAKLTVAKPTEEDAAEEDTAEDDATEDDVTEDDATEDDATEDDAADEDDRTEAVTYIDAAALAQPQDEEDAAMDAFWPMRSLTSKYHSWEPWNETWVAARERIEDNLQHSVVEPATLARHVTRRPAQPGAASFAQRYAAPGAAGAAYRALVVATLRGLLETNPTAITANAVFGGLWRAVAQDRASPDRDDLVALFSRQVDGVAEPAARARLRAWLDASYDFAAEIRAVLDAVPPPARFPCVFLDPTLDFSQQPVSGGDEDAEEGAFTRSDLLEIGRSCSPAILRRLGRALTRLTYVATADDLPAHVAGRDAVPSDAPDYVPRIPLSLAGAGAHSFWRVLLHAFVPGTRLGARPAALLAALSLRMGIEPLRDVAVAEMRRFRGRWNDLAIPETWNVSCLSLLLAADRAAGAGDRADDDDDDRLLSAADRRLFATLVDYHMADRNRATTLTARVGWTPDKARAPVGPAVRCRQCGLPRSVTMMAPDHVCGLCAAAAADPDVALPAYASDPDAPPAWVECSVRACRAQYVVYGVDALRVRPKCHACRMAKRSVDAPGDDKDDAAAAANWVTCSRCWNRIVCPPAYREPDMTGPAYCCPACSSALGSGGLTTVVDEPTTVDALVAENGLAWLLRNDGGKIADPLSGRSLFQTVSQAGVDGFCDQVAVLPTATVKLTLRGKPLHNVPALLDELRSWIDARRAERDTCSLCFDTFRRAPASGGGGGGGGRGAGPVLRRACGRRGCAQRICPRCSADWYGLNRRGRVLNVAALRCPFCRRPPTPSTVAAAAGSAAGLHLLANLRAAVDDAGATVYAWCYACGEAKPYAARVCGAAAADDGAAAPVERWHCDACLAAAEAAAAVAAAAATPTTKGDHAPPLVIKPCPGCGAPTEKASGCNHIACTAPGCTAHWCFQCGEQVPEATIYEHMNAVHNGFYGGMGGAYDDGSDDGDDDDDPNDVCQMIGLMD